MCKEQSLQYFLESQNTESSRFFGCLRISFWQGITEGQLCTRHSTGTNRTCIRCWRSSWWWPTRLYGYDGCSFHSLNQYAQSTCLLLRHILGEGTLVWLPVQLNTCEVKWDREHIYPLLQLWDRGLNAAGQCRGRRDWDVPVGWLTLRSSADERMHTPDIRQEAIVRVEAESKTFNGCCGILLYLGKKVLHSFMPRNVTATVYRCALFVHTAFV